MIDFGPIKDVPGYTKILLKVVQWKAMILLFLTLASSLLETFGVILIVPLLAKIFSSDIGANNNFDSSSDTINLFLDYMSVYDLFGAICLLFMLKGIIIYLSFKYSATIRGSIIHKLKKKIYYLYKKMDYNYYSTKESGYFVNIINEQVHRYTQSFYYLNQFYVQLISGVIFSILSFLISPRVGVLLILITILIFFILKRISISVQNMSRLSVLENTIISSSVIRQLKNFKYITSTNTGEFFDQEINNSITKLSYYQSKSWTYSGLIIAVKEPISIIAILAVFLIQITVFKTATVDVLASILLFHRALNYFMGANGSLQNTVEFIGSLEAVDDEIKHLENFQAPNFGKNKAHGFDIEFKNVDYSFDVHKTPILKDISFKIQEKTTIALVGASGSGKTSILDLMTGVLKASDGIINVGGKNIDNIDIFNWRNNIGYVSQDSIIFAGNIRDNITLWLDKDSEIEEKVIQAAKMSNIWDHIKSLPDGLDTIIGEEGVNLSGGQKQRIFIARELFREPKVLILDEATSALDSISEGHIVKTLNELKSKMTIVIVAHRISTIKKVDKIYVLSQGKIIESGHFKELSLTSNSFLNNFKKNMKISK